MAEPIDVRLLCRSWLRSRHEDTPTEEVYRPADFAPARRERGRSGYRFEPDGTVRRVGIGPTDVSRVATGQWQVDDEHPDRVRLVVDGRLQVLEVADLAADRLAVRRGSAPGQF